MVKGTLKRWNDEQGFGFIRTDAVGEDVFIPTPEKEYPPVHFLEIARVQQQL